MSFSSAFFNVTVDSQTGKIQHQTNAVDALYDSIRFNLQALLRSEAPMVVLDSRLKQIQRSNWRYGVVDLQSNNRFMEAEKFARQLTNAITFAEPRLSQVKVLVVEHPAKQNQLHLNLTANIDPLLLKCYGNNHQPNAVEHQEALAVELDIELDTLTIERSSHDDFI